MAPALPPATTPGVEEPTPDVLTRREIGARKGAITRGMRDLQEFVIGLSKYRKDQVLDAAIRTANAEVRHLEKRYAELEKLQAQAPR